MNEWKKDRMVMEHEARKIEIYFIYDFLKESKQDGKWQIYLH